MAEDLNDGAFWLPPQFLTDDDILIDHSTTTHKCFGGEKSENGSGFYNPYELPYGFGSFGPNSDLSSPVESVVSSTETLSDEEDYIAELTRKMAQSTLQDYYDNTKLRVMAGSPQSTLCNVLGGCGCKQGSSRGSPNCLSQVASPPSTAAMNRSTTAWDLLYAAAGEVARMKMIEEMGAYYQSKGLLCPPRKPNPISVPLKTHNHNLGFHSNRPFSYHQFQAAQFQQLKQQQSLAIGQYRQNRVQEMGQNGGRNIRGGRPIGLSPSAWPTLQQSQQQQQKPGSGMRAVFLGNHGSKRETTGTGVFLPRRNGTTAETRKKPGCSTVLLPDRVVQALNLNLEAMDATPQLQPRYNGNFSSDYDAAIKYRNSVLMAQQRRTGRPQPMMNNEVRLPQEWTY